MKQLVEYQQSLHGAIGQQDVYKLSYQAAFGVEHILSDTATVRAFLLDEMSSLDSVPFEEHLVERISLDDSMIRVNLRPFKRLNLPPEKLVQTMFASGRETTPDTMMFYRMWNEFGALVKYGMLTIEARRVEKWAPDETGGEIRSVLHSHEYAIANHPAYRVVRRLTFEAAFGEKQ
jgi:hypothetical protein